MNIIRYLAFEINRECPNYESHKGICPISHPDRYKFSTSDKVIGDSDILNFWRWSRSKGFRGIVQWHSYNEPVLSLDRILNLMKIMKSEDKFQPFQLTTSIEGNYPEFDIVRISSYGEGMEAFMDKRINTNTGEGKPYEDMPKRGWCGRGKGWEIVISNFGDWCLCCGDWLCEESVGSIMNTDWEILYGRWKEKRKTIQWHDEKSYKRMPRLCRACFDKNPILTWKAGI